MATEGGGFNPIPVLVHLVAIALGLYLGFVVMDRLAPDLPDDSVEPGVSSSSAPGAVAGDDPDSLYSAANLAPALAQLDDQLAAGQGIASLHLEPGSLDADTSSVDGTIAPGDVGPEVPALLASEINAERGKLSLADVALLRPRRDPQWAALVRAARHQPRHRATTVDLRGAARRRAARGRGGGGGGGLRRDRSRTESPPSGAAPSARLGAVIDSHTHLSICEPDDAVLVADAGVVRGSSLRRIILPVNF